VYLLLEEVLWKVEDETYLERNGWKPSVISRYRGNHGVEK